MPRRANIYTEHVLTDSRAQKCRLDGLFEMDERAALTRAVADLWCLDTLVVEPTVASSQQSIERGSTLCRCGRMVATRRPVVGGAWCVPESSRTSGLSAGSGDLRGRRSTADTCLGASNRLERACRAATCVRSSAGSEGRSSVVRLSPVPFS